MKNPISFTIGREDLPGSPVAVNFTVNGMTGPWSGATTGRPDAGKVVPAGDGLRVDVAGSWQTYSAEFSNGTELIVSAMRGATGGRKTSSKVIRADERAPYQRLSINTAQRPNSTFQTVGIEGRFYILSQEDALAKFNPGSMRSVQVVDTSVQWQTEELHPGAVLPDVVNKTMVVDGETFTVATSKRKRALRL